MSGEYKYIVQNLLDAATIAGMVVVPLVVSLFIVDVVRRLQMLKRLTARGFEVKPVSPPREP